MEKKQELYQDKTTNQWFIESTVIKKWHEDLGTQPNDDDITFEKKSSAKIAKASEDKREELLEKKRKLVELYRNNLVAKGDTESEERCIKNIGNIIIKVQEEQKRGKKIENCLMYKNQILIYVYYLSEYFYYVMCQYIRSKGYDAFLSTAYEDTIKKYIEEELSNRIWNAKHENKGMVANYDPSKSFVHFFRACYGGVKINVLEKLIKNEVVFHFHDAEEEKGRYDVSLSKIDQIKENTYTDSISELEEMSEHTVDSSAYSMSYEIDDGQLLLSGIHMNGYEELLPSIICVIEQGAAILSVLKCAKKGKGKAEAYTRLYILNMITTLVKEICTNQKVYWGLFVAGKEEELFSSFHREFLDFIMSDTCSNLFDVSETPLKKYKEVNVLNSHKEDTISFVKKGIKYLDDIWCNYRIVSENLSVPTEEQRKKYKGKLKTEKSVNMKRITPLFEKHKKEWTAEMMREFFRKSQRI